jgi:hypothetical protein
MQHLRARTGEINFLAQLLEQRQPGVSLELFDLRGHCRLGQMQFLCGARKAQQSGDCFEYF